MDTRIIKLAVPVEVAGETVAEVEIRRTTIGDEEDAMDQAIRMKKGKNNLTIEMCTFARMLRMPYDKIRQMNSKDYSDIRRAWQELMGVRPPAEDDENPMTQ